MSQAHRAGGCGGFTLLEVLVASAVGAVIAGGTMMAFVTAARLTRGRNNPGAIEAGGYVQQTIERFRNRIACDQPGWFDPATCEPLDAPGAIRAAPPVAETDYWVEDPFVGVTGVPYVVGNQSILYNDAEGGIGPEARRCYRAWQVDCDGDGAPGDCYAVQAQLCWHDPAGCTCPPMA